MLSAAAQSYFIRCYMFRQSIVAIIRELQHCKDRSNLTVCQYMVYVSIRYMSVCGICHYMVYVSIWYMSVYGICQYTVNARTLALCNRSNEVLPKIVQIN